MAINQFSNNTFSNKFVKQQTTDVDIIDEMNAYSQLLSKSKQKEYNKVQEEKDKPSFFQKVISVLTAGETGQAAYDLVDGKNPVASYGKSIIEGISGQGYSKKTYADVLEKLGMKRGALSEIMPWLYNETGEGIKFKKGGLLDPTARGALGLTLDILGDPTTYLGGAGLVRRGITSMKGLSKSGKEVAKGISRKYAKLADDAMKAGDQVGAIKFAEEMSEKIATKMKSNPDKYFSGLKFMGKEIIPRKMVLTPGRYAEKTMQHIPILNKVYAGAKEGVQDVFKYGADILREGKKLGRAGEETAEKYIGMKKKLSREADWSFEKLYRSLNDTRKDFHNAVSKADRETAQKYIIDKIQTNMGQFGIKDVDPKTADNIIEILKRHQSDIYKGTEASRAGLKKEMFDELQGYLPSILTPEAKKAMAKLNTAKYRGSSIADYLSKTDKSIDWWKFKAADGTEIMGKPSKLGLQTYNKAAETRFLQKRYSKLIKTQEKYLNEVFGKVKGLEKQKMKQYLKFDDSLKIMDNETLFNVDRLDSIIKKYEGKSNQFSMAIDGIKKELRKNIDNLPDANTYFKDKTGKVFVKDRAMSITEKNSSPELSKLMKDMGFEGKNFFETDPFAITLSRGQGAVREIEKNSLLRDASEQFGIKGDSYTISKRSGVTRRSTLKTKYPDKYVDDIGRTFTEPGAGRMRYIDPEIKELPEGTLLPEFIVADLKKTKKALESDDVVNKILKNYDKVMNTWKSSVYGWFPASHGRNYIGGSFMNFNANPNWVKHTNKVKKILKGSDEVIDLGGKNIYKGYTYNQFREELAKRGLFSQTGALDIMDLNKSFNNSFYKKAADIPLKAGTFVESNLRVPLFLAEIANGKTLDDAMSTVYKYHFDYAPRAATEIERSVLKRLIPFYTWQRNAIPLMVEELIASPGRMSSFYKAIRNADDGSGEINRALLPSYLERDPAIMAGGQAISGFGMPPNEVIKFFDDPISAIESSLTPALKIPIEIRTNFNTFKDKQISEDVNGEFARNYPQVIKDWLEFEDSTFKKDGKEITYSRVNPMRKYWLYALPTGRLSSIVSMTLGDNEKNKAAKIMTGISTIDTDLEQMKASKDKEYEKKLKEILINAGIYSEYGSAFKSSKEKLRQLDSE